MRRLVSLLLFGLMASSIAAKERTLFGGPIEHGGFGGPYVKFTSIHDQFGVLVGGRGGWIINHVLAIGGGGCGLANHVNSGRPDTLINFGYGGGQIEWIIRSDEVLHFTVETLIGGGGIDLEQRGYGDHSGNGHQGDGVFVGELSFNLELNMATWFRLAGGAGYRLVSGVEIEGLENSDFSGPSATLMLKFGKF